MTNQHPSRSPIAVVGASALFPGSIDATGFWRDILAGRDLLTDVPASHWLIEDYYDPDPSAPDKTYAKRGGFLSDVDFDAIGWGIPPNLVPETDTSQLLALIVAQKVLEDASAGQPDSLDRSRMSVILGCTSGQELMGSMVSRLQRPVWVKALRESGIAEDQVQAVCERISASYTPWRESTFPGLLGNVVAGRIANRLNLGGTNCVTDAACASTLSALAMAVHELQLGESDFVITGGVDTMNDIFMYVCFSKTPALSPSGDCRPFSDKADGTMLSEGLGMIALKRLADAEAAGDRIYAVIHGVGSSSDGRAKSVYAPRPEGQATCLRRAYEQAGFGPETVELVEAHGTGTKAGDAAEFAGLSQVFGETSRKDKQWCSLGSVKSQIGHAKSAAGAAGLFKAVMALSHRVLPPTAKVEAPNPALELEASPFNLTTRARPWVKSPTHPRRASVSSFGFGGSNFHVTLEEHASSARRAPRLRTLPTELYAFSAESPSALCATLRQHAQALAQAKKPAAKQRLASWLGHQSCATFDAAQAARVVIVSKDADSLELELTRAAAQIEGAPEQAFATPTGTHYGVGALEGEVAQLFPGQGSQYLDMGSELAQHFDAAIGAWDRAASVSGGWDTQLASVVFPITAFTEEQAGAQRSRLNATEWAQPAIACVSLAQLALLSELGLEAKQVAGHSFGEVMALHAAGCFDAQSAVRIARRRGELMAAAAKHPGAMLALTTDSETAARLLTELQGSAPEVARVVIANHNSPKQVVLSGRSEGIDAAERFFEAQGISTRRLPVATAFHSEVVSDASAEFSDFLQEVEFNAPCVAAYANSSASRYPADISEIKRSLGAQLSLPVRFVEQIEAMYASGVRTFVEVGPGSVLSGLVGSILGDRPHRAIALDRKGKHGVTAFFEGVAALAAAGVRLELSALWNGFATPTDPATISEPKLALPLNGSNYQKPYPPAGGAAALPPPNPKQAESMSTRSQSNGHGAPQAQSTASNGASNGAHSHGAPSNGTASNGTTYAGTNGATSHAAPSAALAPSRSALPLVSASAQPSGRVSDEWAQAYSEVQRQTAEAHATYLNAMAASHMAFLDTVERSFLALSGVPTEMSQRVYGPLQFDSAQAAATPAPSYIAPSPPPAPETAWAPEAQAAPSVAPVVAQQPVAPAPVAPVAAPAPVAAAAPAPAPTPVAAPAAPSIDLHALLLEVVAEKTGYPTEMLNAQMTLEGDLGIDSIKRVEILSGMQERAPGLPQVDTSVMAKLSTLGQIVDYMNERLGQTASAAPAAAPTASAPASAAAPAASNLDLHALLLEVVAEKTGYPTEMLNAEMTLEGDLGIDSIKRVEILSGMQERAPGLPQVDTSVMAKLSTLGQIVDYMNERLAGGGAKGTSSPKASAPDVATATLGDPTEDPAAGRYAALPFETPALGLAPAGVYGGGLVVVTRDGSGLAEAVAAQLSARGVFAECVDQVPSGAFGVIALEALRPISSVEQALDVNRAAFRTAKQFAASEPQRGLFVSVQDTGGAFGGKQLAEDVPCNIDALRAYTGGVAGLTRTVGKEYPGVSVKAVDLARGELSLQEQAARIVSEVLDGGPDADVGLSAGRRFALRNVRLAAQPSALCLAPKDVVLVSGGARGVTANCLLTLAEAAPLRFVLLGRTALTPEPQELANVNGEPALKAALIARAKQSGAPLTPKLIASQLKDLLAQREIRGTLSALEQRGSEARYLAIDVADGPALEHALETLRRDWGPISAVIHGAGVIADKRIAEKTVDSFDWVFDTKVQGLRALLSATASDPLKALIHFSSVAARTGNQGQSDYAMANEVLNVVAAAEAARRPGAIVRSLGWGPWQSGMVTPELRAHFERMGVPLISEARGALMLKEELCSPGHEPTAVVLGGDPDSDLHPSSEPREAVHELLVGPSTHPYLADHAVDGVPAVPVVLAMEWLARAAQAYAPHLELASLRDVRVLRGIVLRDFNTTPTRLVVRCKQVSNGHGIVAQLELSSEHGLHYRCTAALLPRGSAKPASSSASAVTQAALALDPWSGREVYDGQVLFHGPRFQVISQVAGTSEKGAVAVMQSVLESDWMTNEHWHTDPAALDGALQLALLWSQRMLGGASLPTSVASLTLHRPPTRGPLTCTLVAQRVSGQRAVMDIALHDAAGNLLAELAGVETHQLPARPRVETRA
ncbi:MAG: SDR family oxidoreductase [Polyangiaceae bacterium]|nr:SDR family oxidoreductase [Polyangiaceae bacterium]